MIFSQGKSGKSHGKWEFLGCGNPVQGCYNNYKVKKNDFTVRTFTILNWWAPQSVFSTLSYVRSFVLSSLAGVVDHCFIPCLRTVERHVVIPCWYGKAAHLCNIKWWNRKQYITGAQVSITSHIIYLYTQFCHLNIWHYKSESESWYIPVWLYCGVWLLVILKSEILIILEPW